MDRFLDAKFEAKQRQPTPTASDFARGAHGHLVRAARQS
jgi:hypothetical protein